MVAARTSASDRRVAVLGRGAFGEVELVVRRDGRFERLFAKKRLLAVHQEDVELRSMFFEEARLAGMIRHPNVVSVLDVGEDEQGPYLLMDYVEGVSAHRLIEVSLARKSELPLQVCLRIVAQVAEGLHAAHELTDASGRPLGLVHRDVSPANVLVGYDGVARVTDFGVARALGRTTKTSTGFLKGKLGYMSPEQLRFEEPDRRSDLFALGVLLFELIVLQRLYANRDGTDGPRRILNEPPPDLTDHRDDIPDALVQLMFVLLAKDRAHRPADAKAVAVTLEEIVAALTVEEGRIDVAEHLADTLGAERQASAAAMARAREDPATLVEDLEVPGEATRIDRAPSPAQAADAAGASSARPPAAPRRRWISVATAAVLAAGAAVLAVAMTGRPDAAERAAVAAESASSATESAAGREAATAREAGDLAASDVAASPETPRAAEPTQAVAPGGPAPVDVAAAAPPPPAKKPADAPAPRRRAKKPKPAPGVPMWSW